MTSLAGAGQARVDEAVTALAWSLYKPANARELAERAVADTGLGNVTGAFSFLSNCAARAMTTNSERTNAPSAVAWNASWAVAGYSCRNCQ